MKIDTIAVILSLLVGILFVVVFTFATGTEFATPIFPTLAMMSGFILSGVSYGYFSEGETVLEPMVSAVIVSIVSFFIIRALDLRAFSGLSASEFELMMLIAFLNGIILSFAGAWTGEKLQRTYAYETDEAAMEWGWVLAGVVLGVAVSMILANLEIIIFGLYPTYMFGVLFLGLLATGYLCAYRSPGLTMYEAVVAGIITVILLIDIYLFSLDAEFEYLTVQTTLLVLAMGIVSSGIGGYFGERAQQRAAAAR